MMKLRHTNWDKLKANMLKMVTGYFADETESEKEYGSEAETVWENVLKKYAEFMAEAPDYGEKSPHAAQI